LLTGHEELDPEIWSFGSVAPEPKENERKKNGEREWNRDSVRAAKTKWSRLVMDDDLDDLDYEEEPDSESIRIWLRNGNVGSRYWVLPKTTMMSEFIETYALRKGVASIKVWFYFDGERVEPEQTPKMLGLKAGDILVAIVQQSDC
jgi:hypothetical protein